MGKKRSRKSKILSDIQNLEAPASSKPADSVETANVYTELLVDITKNDFENPFESVKPETTNPVFEEPTLFWSHWKYLVSELTTDHEQKSEYRKEERISNFLNVPFQLEKVPSLFT
jgi:hypothetical protein